MRTMREIALQLGLHTSTVSRALDPEKRHLVAADTLERVLAAAHATRFTPDPTAAGLRRRQTSSVGVLVPDLDNSSIIRVVRAITAALERRDYVALIAECMDDPARTVTVLDQFQARRVDAIISLAAVESDRTVLEGVARALPVVLAVRRVGRTSLPTVACDDSRGGLLVAEHLAQLGHRVVAQVCGPRTVRTFRDRARGFEKECKSRGVQVVTVHADHATMAEARRVAGPMLDGAAATAVFAHNDDMAIGVLQVIRERGLECPRVISVVGYNDTEMGRHITPALTTVSWSAGDVGTTAASYAMDAINGRLRQNARSIVQPALVVRASTAPPAGVPRQPRGLGRSPATVDRERAAGYVAGRR